MLNREEKQRKTKGSLYWVLACHLGLLFCSGYLYFHTSMNVVVSLVFFVGVSLFIGVVVLQRRDVQLWENRMGALLRFPDYSPNLIVEVDAQGQIRSANPAAMDLFRRFEKPVNSWFEIVENDFEDLEKICQANTVQIQEVNLGDQTWLIHYRGARETGSVYIYGTDISELNKLRNDMLHSAKLASIGELAAGVGHEINNPLAIAMGAQEILKKEITQKRDSRKTGKLLDMLDKQHRSLQRIKKIVNGLRTYARTHSDVESPLDVHEVVLETLQLVEDMYRKDGIEIVTHLEAENPFILANIGKFQQVLMNMLTNARDALEGEQEIKTIEIQCTNKEGNLLLSLSDNGCGMSKETQEKIFDAFFTTKPVGRGTGLGMGIVSEITQKAKGSIQLESELGKGTRFQFCFPSTKAPVRIQVEERDGSPLNVEKLKGHILLVDDEAELRSVLRSFLEELGLHVTEAASGEEGLLSIVGRQFDCVITDLKMPQMSGIEFFELAKSLPHGETHYILATGGVSTDLDTDEAFSEFDILLEKPFSHEQVYEVLSQLLEREEKKVA